MPVNNYAYILAMLINLLALSTITLKFLPLKSTKTKILTLLVLNLGSLCIPIYNGFNILFLMRGVLSDLSITTGILSLLYIFKNIFKIDVKILSKTTSLVIFLFASILYLSAFGLLPFDIYDLGFTPSIAVICILGLTLLIIYKYNRIISWVLLLAYLCFYFKLQTSINLFDYLFDPVLWIISFLCLIGVL